MRVPIPHSLGKEEVRRRLQSRSHEIGQFVPGGMADVTTTWPHEDRMDLSVKAMGQGIDGCVIVEEDQVIFEINLPPALSFVEPMVAGAIRQHGQKLIAPK
ncbi:polyhydroxyalkanoic acid system family protein [Qipengyuania qiaonensis]|uniref:Polyhydroxyalkanoic acid system family protein n=1 Tax=Qipengyuania qiaonensis TaxID=2867240 RepID=A0ABS7JB04_9SPHN|nr:polyhydroxyalkanoic acid system family protein [Qipengyuania qiaonensis]MBX7482893.1 polyhydroxyalkanoic acid system family protein [Qipengyuania qiaonensis]